MPPPDACPACQTPFPANGLLAAVPSGRRIAFDPARRRVWRLCGACGAWDLLGPEASAAALPELELRAPAPVGRAAGGIEVTGAASRLELLRLGDPTAGTERALALAAETRRIAGEARGRRYGGLILGSVMLAVYALGELVSPSSSTLVMQGAAMRLSHLVRLRWRKVPVPRGSWQVLAIVALPPFVYLRWRHPERVQGALAAMLFMALVMAAVEALFDKGRELPSKKRVPFEPSQAPQLVVDRDHADGVLRLILPDQFIAAGPDAFHLLELGIAEQPELDTEAAHREAHDLVRTLGGVRGVLSATDAWRDGKRPLTLDDLPRIHWLALHLAHAAEQADPATVAEAERHRLDAEHTAEEAERLLAPGDGHA